jgi:type IV fimbrial biogenesis protein FimT
MQRPHGITLPELLTALCVFGICSFAALPGFVRIQRDAARSAAVNEFFHALFLARSESSKRGTLVSLCKSRDGRRCIYSTTDWAGGWVVFVNHHSDVQPQVDSPESILHVYQGWKGGTISSNRAAYSYRPYTQGVINGTIVFCDTRGSAHARAIIISHTGRPRVASRDASQKPLQCPK